MGGSKPISIDVRVIAATNRDLQKCVTEGTFREDLYYRLSVFPVRVPPLRERKLDIPKLARSVIDELNQTYEHKKSLTPGAEALLLQYNWPGNVRELRNVMERAFIMSDGEQIQPQDLAILDGSTLHAPRTISPTYGAPTQDTAAPAPAPTLTGEPLQTQVDRFEAAPHRPGPGPGPFPSGRRPAGPDGPGHLPPPEEKVPSLGLLSPEE